MQPGSPKFDHDLFILFAGEDRTWVNGYLLPSIGLTKPRVWTQDDFEPGEALADEFERAVTRSRFTVLVVSPTFMSGQWELFGEALATYTSIEDHRVRLVPLVLSPVDLPLRLEFRVRLDCTSQENWSDATKRLLALLEQPEPEHEEIPCPYPGILPYSEADAIRYYGREELIRSTVERFRIQKLLTIIGPSGCGKTSFLQAGIIPRLSASKLFPASSWRVLSFRPGSHPLERLASVLSRYLQDSTTEIFRELENNPLVFAQYMERLSSSAEMGIYWLLIIDQFEEVFAQCKKPAEQQRFFELLKNAFAPVNDHWRIILSIRADFYADCQESALWQDIEASLLNLPPLSNAEIQQAIIEPARMVGVYLETALVNQLIDDTEGQKGPLPLLQETLTLMWSRYLHQRLLTLADYESLGKNGLTGLDVALGQWADSSLVELREDNQRAITRRIFLRLIEFGEGRNDTRRQQHLDDLYTTSDKKDDVQGVLEHLVKYRLITVGRDDATGEPLVDLSHERLIEAWPQLGDWLEAYHAMESERRSLVFASTTWLENGKDSSFLLTGKRLQNASEWTQKWEQELGPRDREFLAESQIWDTKLRRRQRITSVSMSIVILLFLSIAGIWGYREFVRLRTGSPRVKIDEGTAIIGSDNTEQNDHEVQLLSYQIEKYEVSNRQYRACDDYGPCEPPINRDDYDDPSKNNNPVVWVTAKQANMYCQWIGGRLPTSVEWERAVRGNDGRLWPWGNDFSSLEDFTPPEGITLVDAIPETATIDDDPIYHLVDNVSEWVVRVTPGCQREECHIIWNGKDDIISYAGGAYDRYIERVTILTNAGSASPDPSIGFRCAASSRP